MHNTPARVYIITQVRWTMRAAAPFRFNARARARSFTSAARGRLPYTSHCLIIDSDVSLRERERSCAQRAYGNNKERAWVWLTCARWWERESSSIKVRFWRLLVLSLSRGSEAWFVLRESRAISVRTVVWIMSRAGVIISPPLGLRSNLCVYMAL